MAEIKTKKLVIVGDGAIGKTCLLEVFEKGEFEDSPYRPTVFHNTVKLMDHPTKPGEQFNLQLWDTAGQEDYATARQLASPNTEIQLIGFQLCDPGSCQNIKTDWMPKIENEGLKGAPILLAGMKGYLRNDCELLDALAKKEESQSKGDLCCPNPYDEPSAGMEECGGPRGAWGFTEKLFSGIPILRCLGPSENHATEKTSSDDILVEPPNKRICMKSSKNDDDKGDPEGDFALALAEKHMQKDGGRSKIEEMLPPRAPETINGNDIKEWVCLYEEMLGLEGDGTAMEKLNNEMTALDYYDPKLLTKLEAIKELKLKLEAED